jgi:hypothetical protein
MVEEASKLFEKILQKMHNHKTQRDLVLKCLFTGLSTLSQSKL